jgi:hypothetical protein
MEVQRTATNVQPFPINSIYTLKLSEQIDLLQKVKGKGRTNGDRRTNNGTAYTIRDDGQMGTVVILIISTS